MIYQIAAIVWNYLLMSERSVVTSVLKILQSICLFCYIPYCITLELVSSFRVCPRVDTKSLYKDKLSSFCGVSTINLYGVVSGFYLHFLRRLLSFQRRCWVTLLFFFNMNLLIYNIISCSPVTCQVLLNLELMSGQ